MITLLLAAGCTTSTALAAPSDSLSVQPGALRLDDIHGRERVRLRLLDDQCLEGINDGVADGRLRLQSRRANVAVDSISAMWVREDGRTVVATRGAFLGLVVGGILAWQTGDALYLLLLPFAGGIAGSMTGSTVSHWEPVQLYGDLPDHGDSPCDPRHCLPCEIAQLHPGNRIRVEATGGRYLEGEIDHGSTEGVSVRVGLQTDDVARSDIERLWVRRSAARKSSAAAAKVMAPLGAIAGGLLFGFASQICWESCSNQTSPVLPALIGVLTGGAFGALVGGVVGAGLGAPFHDWVQLYP